MIRGVLGGSFDPVHNGHVAMARYFLDRDLVQRLHIVPARLSPHKTHTSANPLQRLNMVRLAFLDLPGVVVDNREIIRPGPSYTVDTLESLAVEHPDDQLLLIVGQDNVSGFAHWKDPRRIASLATVAVLARPAAEPSNNPPDLPPDLGLRQQIFHDFDHPVSSTQIRAILEDSKTADGDLADCVPAPVAEYILRNQLYRD